MLKISNNANTNYLAKIFEIKMIEQHSNADRLQVVTLDFQNIITGMEAKKGDVYVYFPSESKLSEDFLSYSNEFRTKNKNKNPEFTGFFDDNCRVKTVKLRGEDSMGYVVPASKVFAWAALDDDPTEYINSEFDTINNKLLIEKYLRKNLRQGGLGSVGGSKSPKLNRIIDGQVNFHVSTPQLGKSIERLNRNDLVSITYKTHGTSFWSSNVKVKRNLKWYETFLKKLGVSVDETEYDNVYGSRRVVKNSDFKDPKCAHNYYDVDLWSNINVEIKDKIPKNYTIYGEVLGFTQNGSFIQNEYDYGCDLGKNKLEIYRVTIVNEDGLVTELSTPQIREFCEKTSLTPSHLFFYGKAVDIYPDISTIQEDDEWRSTLMERLKNDYLDKKCFMCQNNVVEEGIILRKETSYSFGAMKLKSPKFLLQETVNNDKGLSDMEEDQ